MDDGLVQARDEGTPQGGPLSPLLSNVMLDVLDKELERRGHRFVRYADDCNVYVASERAGKRVMQSITSFLARKLKLKVNTEKSAVDRAAKAKVSRIQLHIRKCHAETQNCVTGADSNEEESPRTDAEEPKGTAWSK